MWGVGCRVWGVGCRVEYVVCGVWALPVSAAHGVVSAFFSERGDQGARTVECMV